MPTPPPPRAVRALQRPSVRRLLRLLALTAVALPLVASVAAPIDVPEAGPASVVVDRVTVAQLPARVELLPADHDVAPVVLDDDLGRPDTRVEQRGPGQRPGDTVWDALARCESDGRWDAVRTIDGRPAYRGGLQFAARTWDAFRPEGYPDLASDATREQQIVVAERVLAAQGWEAWPACSKRLGLR